MTDTAPSSCPLGRDAHTTEVERQPSIMVNSRDSGARPPGLESSSAVCKLCDVREVNFVVPQLPHHEMGIIVVPLSVTMRISDYL